MSIWPFGIRGKAIRLLNDAGFDVRDAVGSELLEMVVAQSKHTKQSLGPASVSETVLVAFAARSLSENPSSAGYLSRTCSIGEVDAAQAIGALSAEADRQNKFEGA